MGRGARSKTLPYMPNNVLEYVATTVCRTICILDGNSGTYYQSII